MRDLSALSHQDARLFFDAQSGHIPVSMCRLPDARIVWVNQRVMRDDPAFATCGGTLAAYRTHLLRACGYAISATEGAQGDVTIGIADRYGGPGIGYNGGSGRAVVVNGYHVKGVGRTPLVSVLTDKAHASGGAYLEECVREVIFSELAASEFPGGAVPVLAIIDTGMVQVWDLEAGSHPELRCLLVRPVFLRPAHFERAQAYISHDPTDGYADTQRVMYAFRMLAEQWGQDSLPTVYEHLWLTWAEQLAYAFIHRLPHGGDSTSNIALNGRLLDFGGMTAVPSFARISLTWGAATTGDELFTLMQAVTSHAKLLGRYVNAGLASKEAVDRMVSITVQRYQHVLFR